MTVVDCLGLLASKVAADVFDVSSGQYHVSLRDQIVRGRLLVRDLNALDPDFRSLLVIGAGAAGIAVATDAAMRGKRVVLLEANDAPMSLQSSVTKRYVGPFMYEWPWSFSGDQTYPPSDADVWQDFTGCPVFTSRVPLPASEFAQEMVDWLRQQVLSLGNLHVATGVKSLAGLCLKDYVLDFARAASSPSAGQNSIGRKPTLDISEMNWWAGKPAEVSLSPNYIVLAAGMGTENVSLPSHDGSGPTKGDPFMGVPFWKDDELQALADEGGRIVIIGGGDGALQDALRSLTRFNLPLEFVDEVFKDAVDRELLAAQRERLQAIEAQGRLMASWTLDARVWSALDEKCRAVALSLASEQSVRSAVLACFRQPQSSLEVTLLAKHGHFDKAYLLNRFVVHLLNCVFDHVATDRDRMFVRFMVKFEVAVTGVESFSSSNHIVHYQDVGAGRHEKLSANHVVVRFGVDKENAPGFQMIQLGSEDSGQRTTFSHIPLPFAV